MVTTKFYLDKRSEKLGGYPLKLRISVKREAAFISLDVTLPADQWDPIRQVVKKNCVNSKKLNEYLSRRKSQIDECIRNMILDGLLARATARSVRDAILGRLYPSSSCGSFMANYRSFSSSHNNPRTRAIYAETESLMRKFDDNLENLEFKDVTRRWIDDFYAWMVDRGSLCVNSMNLHLRNIRASFNSAIDNELTTNYPFRKIKLRRVPTKKRSLNADELRKIFSAKVPDWEQKYVDAFKLIFLLIGINTVDLLSLKKGDYKDGRISYSRAKTKRLYDILVIPEAQEILDRYPGDTNLLSWSDGRLSYRSFAKNLNIRISEILPGVTSYYARHSWATVAASLEIPKETIAAALGHGGNSVTDVYINFDTKKVDEANRRVVDYVLYGKLKQEEDNTNKIKE